MTFSYDLSTSIGKLRLYLPDNDSDNYDFSDEELQIYIDLSNENLTLARVHIYRSLASKCISSFGDKVKVDDIQIEEDREKAKKYLDLAKQLEESMLSGLGDFAIELWAGGVFESDIASSKDEQDSGLIRKPMFAKDTFSNIENDDVL